MSKGSVPQIVAQGNGLGQALIEPECLGNGPGNLGNLKGMGQARPVVIPFRREKHLGLMLKPAK